MIRSRIIPSHTSLGPLGSQPPSFVILSDARRSAATKCESKDLLCVARTLLSAKLLSLPTAARGKTKRGTSLCPPLHRTTTMWETSVILCALSASHSQWEPSVILCALCSSFPNRPSQIVLRKLLIRDTTILLSTTGGLPCTPLLHPAPNNFSTDASSPVSPLTILTAPSTSPPCGISSRTAASTSPPAPAAAKHAILRPVLRRRS